MSVKISKNKSNEINIFDLGTLLQFETHSWQARKGIPNEAKKKITEEIDWITGYNRLIKQERLQGINSVLTEVRKYVWDISLPFVIKSVHFVPNQIVENVNTKLKEFSDKLKEEVESFAKDYDKWIKESEKALKKYGLFDIDAYPQNVRDRYSINWRFFDIVIPNGITEKMYKEESEKIKIMMEETKQNCIIALREGFSEIIMDLSDTLTGKLNGEERRVRPESLEKVNSFFEALKYKNLFNDNQLQELVSQAKNLISDVTPKDLRNDEALTKLISSELKTIKEELLESTETYKRKLTF